MGEMMAGDGGYAKAWRHYVSVANFADAGSYVRKVSLDLVNLQHQVDLDGTMRAAIDSAAKSTVRYLTSLDPLKLAGDTPLRDAALVAIDHMEATLKVATGRYD